ncbi:MAG: amidase [Deltaproteobacteria bacterium]|nr:amidase [Deltaproteobacteria bacterium]
MKELLALDATAQAEKVRSKEVSPKELVEASIDAIERVNPQLNCVILKRYETARAAAQGNLPDGPFRGVPFLLKDIFGPEAGVTMTMGCRALKDHVAERDSVLTERYRAAGLIFLGRTNAPELGILPTTEPALFGACKNPWDLSRSTGGSSGGAAAAVAAGLVPFAHANDGGGSIRIPASCCGLFGLKPTRGRTTLGPEVGDVMSGLVAEHAVTRTVRDSAALLDAVHGPSPGDPYFAPPPARPYREELGQNPGRLRIALIKTSPLGLPVDPGCIEAVEDTAKLLESLGHHVEEAGPAIDGIELQRHFLNVWAAGNGALVEMIKEQVQDLPPDPFEPLTLALAQMGQGTTGTQYLQSVGYLQRLARTIAEFMRNFDLLLTPTLAEPPLLLGELDSPADDPLRGLMRAAGYTPFTPIANATGQPAMSVPLHMQAGLPIGSHFVARYGDEATLFRLAAQLEQARPWSHLRPPHSAA